MTRRGRSGLAAVVVALVWLTVAGCGGDGATDGDEARSLPTSDPDAIVRNSDSTAVPDAPGAPEATGITGRVTSGGRPLEGVLMSPSSLDDPPQAVIEIAILTGGDGRYQWRLGPGLWEMRASVDGYRPATERVEVRAGELATIDFELERE